MNHPEYPAAVAACGEGWLEYHKYTLTDVMGIDAIIIGYGCRTEDGRNILPAGWQAIQWKYYVYRDDICWESRSGVRCYSYPRYEPGWENLTPDEQENLARVEEHKHRQQNPLLAFMEAKQQEQQDGGEAG